MVSYDHTLMVMEIQRQKDSGVTSLIFWGPVP